MASPAMWTVLRASSPRDVPKSTDHTAGDVHAYGNPHYMLDPVLAKTAVANIYKALVAFAPQYKAEFTQPGCLSGQARCQDSRMGAGSKPLKGVKFVSYHEHWPYFAKRFGMDYFGTIELRPGIDPTPRHIEELITTMRAEHVPIVVREPQFPEKVPRLIAAQTGATMVRCPSCRAACREPKLILK